MSFFFCISGALTITKVSRNNKNRGKFRHLARQISGEVFDVPEDNLIIFATKQEYSNTVLVGQICFSVADLSLTEPANYFDSEYYPQISFLFIHKDFQYCGYGTMLMQEALKIIRSHDSSRPIRVQAAENAVQFFEKLGFSVQGEPVHCVHSGSKLFRTIINMELCQS